MTSPHASPPPDSSPPPDPSGGLKVAGLALLAWALIGLALRLTSGVEEFGDELFVLALLAPAAVGVALSVRALLKSSDKFLSTMGLILNVFLVMAAAFLWISTRTPAP